MEAATFITACHHLNFDDDAGPENLSATKFARQATFGQSASRLITSSLFPCSAHGSTGLCQLSQLHAGL